MYIDRRGYTYYTGSGQRHTRAPFLILFSDNDNNLYAATRKVALRQLGHFMMGTARIGGQSIVVSGPYGNDGLPSDLTDSLRPYVTRVPDEIAAEYWASTDRAPYSKALIDFAANLILH